MGRKAANPEPRESRMKAIALLLVIGASWISGCCVDVDKFVEKNARLGNTITYKDGRVCSDSTRRGLSSSARVCVRPCPKKP
jgi:hypothetical protein